VHCIAIVERQWDLDWKVMDVIRRNLEEVFGNSVGIDTYYVYDLGEQDRIDADVVLVPVYSVLPSLINKLVNLRSLVLCSRTIRREGLDRIFELPVGTEVLIVNASTETAHDMVRLLYELGVHHIRMTAYEPGVTDLSRFDVCITPGERLLVPESIGTIIDVGYRILDTQTFLSILTKLKINDERIFDNLLAYVRKIPRKNTDVEERFVNSLFTNRVFREFIELKPDGVLVFDDCNQIKFMNREAEKLLRIKPLSGVLVEECLPAEIAVSVLDKAFSSGLFQIADQTVSLVKTELISDKQMCGYMLTLRSAKSNNNVNVDLSARLRASGLYARFTFSDISFRSQAMARCIQAAKHVAPTDYTVLIRGETGTGKELFAQSIHNYSLRRDKPFVAINCAALPESLLESELFGYERGAFTGSRREGKLGLIEQANGGTLFLDEIGDISLPLQGKLLRTLQEKQIVRIGGTHVVNVDIRIIAATNCDLEKALVEGQFRRDLYYRLNVFSILLPPLRERKEDILFLFRGMVRETEKDLTPEVERRLLLHPWLGNVRELQNVAKYFRLMKELPAFIAFTTPVYFDALQCKMCVLRAIGERHGSGIGRAALIEKLAEAGLRLSTARLEELLKSLCEQGLIVRHRGRRGCVLTPEGERQLTNMISNN